MRKRGALSSVGKEERVYRLTTLSKLTRVYMADARLPKYITTAELAGGWWLSATTNFFDVPLPLTSLLLPSPLSFFSLLFPLLAASFAEATFDSRVMD